MSKYTENFPNLSTYDFDTIMCQLKQVCGADPSGLINAQFLSRPTTAKDIALLLHITYELFQSQVELQKQFVELYNFLKDYVDNLDIQKYVNEWLDEKLKDGTIEDLLNSEVLNNILKETGNVVHNYPFTWRDDQYANYKDMIFSVMASYFVNEVNNLCVVGKPTGRTTPFYAKYNDGNTYMGLLGQGTFTYTDTEMYNGESYPVLYCDCSAFVSLMTKGRKYTDSPYYHAFNGQTNENTLRKYAREIGTWWTDEYTFDFLNKIVTYWMADLLNNSGCPLHTLSTYSAEEGLKVNEDEFTYLQTGDILFNGNSELTNRYRGIHHCMIYVKSLDELQPYGVPYGVTFKALLKDEDNEDYGYIIHCDGDNGILKIETLYERMTQIGSTNPKSIEYMYYSHAVHTTFNSSKAYFKLSGVFHTYNNLYLTGRQDAAYNNAFSYYMPYVDSSNGRIMSNTLSTNALYLGRGRSLKSGDDLNSKTLENCNLFCDNPTIAAGIQNSPWNDRAYVILQFGVLMDEENPQNSRYGVMLAFNQPDENGECLVKCRTRGYVGVWSQWRNILAPL